MWNHFCLKPKYRNMTDESCWKLLMEVLEKWAEKGYSEYTDETKTSVTHPDHHSHSWLNIKEFEEVLRCEELKIISETAIEYYAILKVMKTFEDFGYEIRIVFWFDN